MRRTYLLAIASLAAALAWAPPASGAGCELCPPGGDCVWDSCYQLEGCSVCTYECPEMDCQAVRCPGEEGGELYCWGPE